MTDPIPPTREPVVGEPVEQVRDRTVYRPVDPVTGDTVYRTVVPGYVRAIQIVWFIAGLIDVLVGLRFVLKLFGASEASPFVTLLYALTAPLVGPFQNIFPESGQRGFVFEPASLVAIAIYPLIAFGVVSLIRIISQRRTVAT
jgi:uncharacterized protein YggT (Ycf19 family)